MFAHQSKQRRVQKVANSIIIPRRYQLSKKLNSSHNVETTVTFDLLKIGMMHLVVSNFSMYNLHRRKLCDMRTGMTDIPDVGRVNFIPFFFFFLLKKIDRMLYIDAFRYVYTLACSLTSFGLEIKCRAGLTLHIYIGFRMSMYPLLHAHICWISLLLFFFSKSTCLDFFPSAS